MQNRRTLLKAGLAGLIAAPVAGRLQWMTPAAAAESGLQLSSLTTEEGRLLGEFAASLVIGAIKQGVVPYIDHHITVPARESLLTLRYLDIMPPYLGFYRDGLAALAALCRQNGADGWADLPAPTQSALVAALQQGKVENWKGPPPPLFYFAVRSDAVDVVYGTMAGFDALGIPYLAHIPPEQPW